MQQRARRLVLVAVLAVPLIAVDEVFFRVREADPFSEPHEHGLSDDIAPETQTRRSHETLLHSRRATPWPNQRARVYAR